MAVTQRSSEVFLQCRSSSQVFPKVPPPGGINPLFSDCAKYALAVKPKKGDAILFHRWEEVSQDSF